MTDGVLDTSPVRIGRLLGIMASLRDPVRGCAWDLAQTPSSIASHTLEEAYEVVDAIEHGRPDALKDELGDLLLQVVFHAQMARENSLFSFDDVVEAIIAKLIRRHPHIFRPDGLLHSVDAPRPSEDEVTRIWNAIKDDEKRSSTSPPASALGAVPPGFPALTRALKVSVAAANHGFDWPDIASVADKVREELDEVVEASVFPDPAAVAEELGDLLFAVINLSRHLKVDPETALRRGTLKFERRFNAMADKLDADGSTLAGHGLGAMEEAWQAVKRDEKIME